MASYDQIKPWLQTRYPDQPRNSFSLQLSASLASGLITTTITAPLDVVKTRLMSEISHSYRNHAYISTGHVHTYSSCGSTWTALLNIAQNEGPRALFRGWLPNYMRQGPQTMIILLTIERLRALITSTS